LTNEEQRVPIYAHTDIPTVSKDVQPDTQLEDLNLNWREKDLPENERTRHVHRLHPYLGKYIPQLVEIFLRKYFAPGQTIVDPFVGSGTTLVQANELGINAIGYDISAFNVLLCRSKTMKYDQVKAKAEILSVLGKVKDICDQHQATLPLWQVDNLETSLSEVDREYLNAWFAPQALAELLTYRQIIETGYEYQDLLKVILSRSARSARLITHFDLDFPKRPQTEPYHCYKHARECHPTTEALKFLERYSLDTIKRIEQFANVRTDATTTIHHANSRYAHEGPIDGVITSPPYVGLIDYHGQHAYAYHLLGLEDRRIEEIGPAVSGSSMKAKKLYQEDIAMVFSRLADHMPRGGRMIVVAGDKANLYPEIAEMVGVEVEAVVQRHVNRRTGRRSGEFFESVFIWRKR
jgi:hypothetical protein